MWLSDDEQELWRGYLTMTTRLQAAMNRQLDQVCGITLADYDVLVALAEQGPMRQGELGATLGWEQSRVSHQVRRMRERGLLKRSADAADGRGAVIAVTAAGRAQLRAAAPGHAELVRSVVFESMTSTQSKALRAWVSRVLTRLE